MREIKGKYRDINYEALMKFGGISHHYESLLRDVYGQNSSKVPLDILASMLEIISYPKYIRNYISEAEATNLEYGEARKLIDREILTASYSENLLNMMVKYNIIPYQKTKFMLTFITPEVDVIADDDPGFIMFRTSIAELLGDTAIQTQTKRCSNRLFMDGLYMLLGERPYELHDLHITSKQLFQKIALDSVVRSASDVYIDPKEDHINISFAIFNEKVKHTVLRMNRTEIKSFVNSVIEECGENADKIDWAAEGGRKDMKMLDYAKLDGRYEGRVNLTITPMEGIVSPQIRVHDTNKTLQPFEKIKLNDEPKSELRNIMRNKNGLFLIAGGTGAGKSTTLYSCIDLLLKTRPGDRIEEMSDPIEMQIDDISQLKLDLDMGMSFKGLSQSTTRRNPKIILLGEINSPDSAEFAVDQAIKDLFILTTTHAGSASLIPARIEGLTLAQPFIYREFTNLLKGLAHQRMLKQACPHCSKMVDFTTLGAEDKSILKAYDYNKKEILVERPDPDCPICGGLGYLVDKPVVCLEVLALTDDIRERIFHDPKYSPKLMIDTVLRERQLSGINDALRYLNRGMITYDMMYRAFELFNLDKELILQTKRA